jgi:hypothetical protein
VTDDCGDNDDDDDDDDDGNRCDNFVDTRFDSCWCRFGVPTTP